MSEEFRPDDWLRVFVHDYRDYLKDGGACARVIVTYDDDSFSSFNDALRKTCRREAWWHLGVDASKARLHFPNELVSALAGGLDWKDIAQTFLRQVIERSGYAAPASLDSYLVEQVAEANGIEPLAARAMIVRQLQAALSSVAGMPRDLRMAISNICEAQLKSAREGEILRGAMLEWLRGNALPTGALRKYGLFQRINRQNARPILCSLLSWLATVDGTPVVTTIDCRSLTSKTMVEERGDTRFKYRYTRLAVLDAFEVMREFIDDVPQLQHLALLFVVTPEFLDFDPRGRGLGGYDALRHRVYDEIRLVGGANPLGMLVRLSKTAPKVSYARA